MHPYSFITFPLDCELCESRTFANVCVCRSQAVVQTLMRKTKIWYAVSAIAFASTVLCFCRSFNCFLCSEQTAYALWRSLAPLNLLQKRALLLFEQSSRLENVLHSQSKRRSFTDWFIAISLQSIVCVCTSCTYRILYCMRWCHV